MQKTISSLVLRIVAIHFCLLSMSAHADFFTPSLPFESIRKIPLVGNLLADIVVGPPIPIVVCEDIVEPKYMGNTSREEEEKFRNTSPEDLYSSAINMMQAGDYCEAGGLLKTLNHFHPYSFWSRTATAQSALAFLLAGDAFEAEVAALEFLKMYPNNSDTVLVEQILLLSFVNDILDPKVSGNQANEAIRRLLDWIKKNPNSPNLKLAHELGEKAADSAAAYELNVAKFYFNQGTPALNFFQKAEKFEASDRAAILRVVNLLKYLSGSDSENEAFILICKVAARSPQIVELNTAKELILPRLKDESFEAFCLRNKDFKIKL